ncbi:gluconokinase [Allostreptomyces psammosilenae]|uniref:Gluconokinase n=1 Tax=Allostreptomyces psammosilenae TaxID=1892865 RepID=A0A853AAG0_9ACTN|nr:gluconokinase [Allostreptomyces psammosilenae]NYI07362.1 gluconokinase [Allostreptomyces psammosilenae]
MSPETRSPATTRVIVVMGVSGVGKTTIGPALAERLGVPYAEADSFHPPANIAKMSAGTPLNDEDRAPWLDAIADWARSRRGLGGVVSCSALKRAYRDRLRATDPDLFFLHLDAPREVIAARLGARTDHFMPTTLLDSQLATLERLEGDEAGAVVRVDTDPATIIEHSIAALRRSH